MSRLSAPPGRRDQRVTIEKIRSSPTLNASNEADLSDDNNWETHAVRWARVTPRGGRENFTADQTTAVITHDVFLASDPKTRALDAAMRLRWGAKTLQIVTTFDVDSRRIEQYAGCRES